MSRRPPACGRVLDFLTDQDRPTTGADIAQTLDLPRKMVDDALVLLVEEGRLTVDPRRSGWRYSLRAPVSQSQAPAGGWADASETLTNAWGYKFGVPV